VTLHVTEDVSAYARSREQRLARVARDLGVGFHRHPGHVAVPAGQIGPSGGGDHFKVFTPYWRRWREQPWRQPVPIPRSLRLPDGLAAGRIPDLHELVHELPSPSLLPGGESAARARVDAWFDEGIGRYEDGRDLLADDGTSRLSADLHFGTISVAEIIDRLDPIRPGHEAFLRQLCWREFNHQLLAANPDLPWRDYRRRDVHWSRDDEAFEAWADGRTGVPVVDAGMRQLRHEGWMHNRARLLTANYLTKHLGIDWRLGAAHFAHWLIDADVANNWASWQWVAGTGTDSRPNRTFNPHTQAARHDPDGRYVARWTPASVR
jgi:deoxyribodipyrimidine photo-lyase